MQRLRGSSCIHAKAQSPEFTLGGSANTVKGTEPVTV